MSGLIRKMGARLSSPETRHLVRQGDLARNRGDWAAALEFYKQAVGADPRLASVVIQMGHAAKELRQFEKAEAFYLFALEQLPEDDDLLLQLGHFEKVRGNLRRAEEWYRKAFALNPANGDAQRETEALSWVREAALHGGTVESSQDLQARRAFYEADPHTDHRGMGDRHRDMRRWHEAAVEYGKHLDRHPEDVDIYAQRGNCLKEAGELRSAEDAYRAGLRIAPRHADLNLQLGHVLKLQHRIDAAIAAYRFAFELCPTREIAFFLSDLGAPANYSALAGLDGMPTAPREQPHYLIDISDLLHVMQIFPTVSGIQRVQLELLRYIVANAGAEYDFVTWFDGYIWELPRPLLDEVLTSQGAAEATNSGQFKQLVRRAESVSRLVELRANDVLITTGVIYFRSDIAAENWRLKRAGVRLGAIIYDYIPLTHPEYVSTSGTLEFATAMSEHLMMLDFAFTISEYVATETKRLVAAAGYPSFPVSVLPLAHAFTAPAVPTRASWTMRIAEFEGREYVLCVGSYYLHKNHLFLLQVWKILLQAGLTPPLLVFAGKHGQRTGDLHAQLASSETLRGYVHIVEGPSDDELTTLYRHCLFSMLPSYVEGWGLPVGESLANGKLCLASNTSSIPEVGGNFALYFDPFNPRECAKLVNRLLSDRQELDTLERRIRETFTPRRWEEVGAQFVSALPNLANQASDDVARRRLLAARPDKIHRIQKRTARVWEYGLGLPPAKVVADGILSGLVLDRNWYKPESWGAWMKGDSGRIILPTNLPQASPVQIVLRLRAAPWSAGNRVHVTAGDGAHTTAMLKPSGNSNDPWQTLAIKLRTQTDARREIDLELRVEGIRAKPWWGEQRDFTIGICALFWSVADHESTVLPPNVLHLVAKSASSTPFSVAQYRGLLLQPELLDAGWHAPEPSGCWMVAQEANLHLHTGLPAETSVQLALIMRAADGVVISARQIAGPKPDSAQNLATPTSTSIGVQPNGAIAERCTLLACQVGSDGSIHLAIQASLPSGEATRIAAYPIAGLVGLIYSEGTSVAERLAMTEALLFRSAATEAQLPAEDGINFTVVGHIKGSYSLAAVNRSLSLALETKFPGQVRIEQVENGYLRDLGGLQMAERQQIFELSRRPPGDDGPQIVISQHWPVWVPEHEGDLLLAWVFWEESHLPEDMVVTLNRHFQGVLVPANSVKKALIDSGVRVPIALIGCALDLKAIRAVRGQRALSPPSGAAPFTFLHVSSCFPRKGIDVLLDAYTKTFTRHDPVRLVIKTFPNPHNQVPEQVAELQRNNRDLPRIDVINQDVAAAALHELYREADTVVLPSRGEGFNLPALETLAAGIPLIVTGYGAQMDFLSASTARLLRYHFDYAQTHLNASSSIWVEPDVEDLCAALREAVDTAQDPSKSELRAAQVENGRAVAAAVSDYTSWADRVANVSREILRMPVLGEPTVAWVSSWNVRCGIAEYSRHLLKRYPHQGDGVTVLYDDRNDAVEFVPGHDGKFRGRAAWRVYDSGSMARLAEAIDQTGAAVVMIQHHKGLIRWPDLTALLNDPRLSRRKVAITLHNVQEFAEGEDRAPLIRALAKVARILVHTVNDLNLMKSYGLIENVSLFVHGSVEPVEPRPVARPLPRTESPLIGAYGFFLPHKGFAALIAAFALLKRNWPAARLRFVTAEFPNAESAAEIAHCRALAERLGLDDIEWITDYLANEDSLERLRACDLVVLPYQDTPESSSAALRTALASGTPVAVTPIRIFDDARSAVISLDGVDSNAIARGVQNILEDQALRSATIEKASAWLAAHSWRMLSKRLAGMLASLVINL